MLRTRVGSPFSSTFIRIELSGFKVTVSLPLKWKVQLLWCRGLPMPANGSELHHCDIK